ncbi:MAG: DnaJ domain-containing protein [Deltaproteobacteria bacterium]|nr:DnaJ domain-containing protein [Deltaproteobacteria bacterium]
MSLDIDPRVDHYKVLGVDAKASADEIKKAYRRLAKQNHPDSTGGDKAKESRFKEISAAYDILGDDKKRAQYDQLRAGGMPGGFPGGFPGGGFQGGGFPGGAPGGGVWDLGDLFGQFFSGGRPGGRVRVERVDFDGEPTGGERRTRRRGRGEPEVADAEFESKVKASDGSWLTVKDGDVHSDLRISFDRAILGTVAEVATVDGKAQVKVPPGTSSGKRLRLRGKGVGNSATGAVGDHYITVHIDVPGDLDDDGKKLLVEFTQRLARRGKRG